MNIRVGHHCRNHQVCLDLWLIAALFDLHRLTGQQTACTEHKHSQPSFHSLPPFSRVSCQRKTCPFGPRLSDGHEPFVTPLRHGVCCGQRFVRRVTFVFPQPRSFCTELWRHTMPAQDEVAHNHTPHLFPPQG